MVGKLSVSALQVDLLSVHTHVRNDRKLACTNPESKLDPTNLRVRN